MMDTHTVSRNDHSSRCEARHWEGHGSVDSYPTAKELLMWSTTTCEEIHPPTCTRTHWSPAGQSCVVRDAFSSDGQHMERTRWHRVTGVWRPFDSRRTQAHNTLTVVNES
ncbi:hypothetical protein PINS_up022105 [Pythium insidiosum]|nr:hypothetical protein PINS_up022105 [Pythium insidiosum]